MARNTQCQLLVNDLLANCNNTGEEQSDWVVISAVITDTYSYALYKNIDLLSYALFLNRDLVEHDWKNRLSELTNLRGDWQRVPEGQEEATLVAPYMFFIRPMKTTTEQPSGKHTDFTQAKPLTIADIDDTVKTLQKELRKMRLQRREERNLETNMNA